MSEYGYLNKPIGEWIELELKHAQKHPNMIREGLHEAVDARISAIQANKRLVSERSRNGKEKRRLLASFADTSTKPANSIQKV